ncbi:sensor domain-containing diguanylate cyclase [Celerinatantimonas diazotrophica]|uniref:PAS domain S-box-containing protein/diguanylate cyclase (GGDEF)-like protein n=1 Tax=Celerinatantimonas diazotrophica TaxID=412034 RepID=A0A4R1J8X2_9GAMM|nr:diguanylate cyclase [Celerinatantimonas diazotrophica]TCK46950.1 PAS domain S-box-containing protein/diguanylate cyclase (GGDEF)-like protein [Celerinatantimonas diazotrophica]CAG9295718.1 hypothetical protein CEDIAZO_00844 [Celerinatantimonas diazotrophica]
MDQLVQVVFPTSWMVAGALAICVVILLILFILRHQLPQLLGQLFIQNGPGAIFIFNAHTKQFLYANSLACEMLPLVRQKRRWQLLNETLANSLIKQLGQSLTNNSGVHWQFQSGSHWRTVRVYARRGHYLRQQVWFIHCFDDEESAAVHRCLKKQVECLHDAFNSLPNFVYFCDRNHQLLGCNQAWANYHGLQAQDMTGKSLHDFFTDSEMQFHQQLVEQVIAGKAEPVRQWIVGSDGQRSLLETNGYPLCDSEHNTLGMMSISADVTLWHELNQALEQENQHRIATEKELHRQNNLIRSVFNASPDPIGFIDANGVVTGGNGPFARLLGSPQSDVAGRNLNELLDPNRVDFHQEQHREIFATGKGISYEFRTTQLVNDVTEERWYEIRKAPYHDNVTGAQGIVMIGRDISERKRSEYQLARTVKRLEKLSFLDGLTQVANRRSFDKVLSQQWNMHRRSGEPLAMLMIDIDCFKQYNDNYGHQSGDKVLIEVAKVLKSVAKRRSDWVARYGGEEFIILMPHTDLSRALQVAQQVLDKIRECKIEHVYSEVEDYLTVSIGVSSTRLFEHYPCQELIRTADHCLYQVKHSGRNNCQGALISELADIESFISKRPKPV